MAYNHALEIFGERRASGEFLSDKSPRPLWNATKDVVAPWHNDKKDGRTHSEIAAKTAVIDLGKGIEAWRIQIHLLVF